MANQPTTIKDVWRSFYTYVIQLIDLREDTDREGTIESVRKYVELRGYNVWILIASAVIASIGLDMNASAVIIGAMLISPLMSPILGIGLSIGINDRQLLSQALHNFVIAIVVTLLTSFIYFYAISPFSLPTEEIMSRTKPTILDVVVALFGGIAGIVAGSHKDKTNALPGVAIATALMPPLCAAGYGLANADFAIWWGAIYLFFINAVIIAIATYGLVRFLDFPLHQHINQREQFKTNVFIAIFVTILVIPSISILLNTLNHIATDRNCKQFVEEVINSEQHEAIKWDIKKRDTIPEFKIYLTGQAIPVDSVPKLEKKLENYPHLKGAKLTLIQTDFSRDKSEIRTQVTEQKMEMLSLLEEQNNRIQQLAALQNQVRELKNDSVPIESITNEIQALFPELLDIKAGQMSDIINDTVIITKSMDAVKTQNENIDKTKASVKKKIKTETDIIKKIVKLTTIEEKIVQIPFISLSWPPKMNQKTKLDYEKRMKAFLKVRHNYDNLTIINQ